jgi:hypothetical protein
MILVAAELTVRMPDLFQQAVEAETASLTTSTAALPNANF